MYLNCHSYYSLRYGTLSLKELVKEAVKHRIKSIALTDINNSSAVFDFVKLCEQNNIHPIVGMEFRQNGELLYIAIAKNTEGFKTINDWLTESNLNKKALPSIAPSNENVFVIYTMKNAPERLDDNQFIGVKIHEVNQLYNGPHSKKMDKLVILHPVTVRNKDTHNLHRLLRAIGENKLVSKLSENDVCSTNEYMLPIDELLNYYEHYPSIIKNTEKLIESCSFEFDFTSSKNKKLYTGDRYSDKQLLESLALEGVKKRYGANNKEAEQRAIKELEIIERMGFSAYFLITWDIIRYSQSRGFYHVGRGSGANSIVGYALGITNVCPIELDLYFERFLNPKRTNPPDFDIDWSWQFRDEILDYIFKRFERGKVAFIATITRFKHRSVMRELGKTFGLPKEELDVLALLPREQHPDNKFVKAIHRYGAMMARFPNNRSVHACGVLISEKPLTYYSPLDLPPKGFPTAQYDMYTGEEIGFEKLDILGQRGIGHIDDCVKLVEENQGKKVDVHTRLDKIKADEEANKLLRDGKSLGCFYVESPAMRGLLTKLQCDSYSLLVAATSIIRPGVSKSGMMKAYIDRHRSPHQFEYMHPVFEEHLKETYGIMIYQEDVIKIAHYFAKLDLADADVLRRAMSGKTRSSVEFDKISQKYFDNCKKLGYTKRLSFEVYRQIESFAGYSFCKAHSASYSVESYQSLYLKAHYPFEFITAVLNNFGGFYKAEVYFNEAKKLGVQLENPCVNNGNFLNTLKGEKLYVGFTYLHNLEKKAAKYIEKERAKRGLFISLQDFIQRISISLDSLEILIFIGAFRFTGKQKNELALEARMLMSQPTQITAGLFDEPIKQFELPVLDRSPKEDAFDEIESLGFPVSYTPFELLQTTNFGTIKAKDFPKSEDKIVEIIGYYVCRKDVRTIKGILNFGCWLDVEGNLFDSVHFPNNLKKYPIQGKGCYRIKGRIVLDSGHPMLEVHTMEKLPYLADPRYVG